MIRGIILGTPGFYFNSFLKPLGVFYISDRSESRLICYGRRAVDEKSTEVIWNPPHQDSITSLC